jgi:hypothetical protein
LPLVAVYGFAHWDLPKNHPVGLVLGLLCATLFIGTIFSWIAWSDNGLLTHPEQAAEVGSLAGLLGFLAAAPGFLREQGHLGRVRQESRVVLPLGGQSPKALRRGDTFRTDRGWRSHGVGPPGLPGPEFRDRCVPASCTTLPRKPNISAQTEQPKSDR